jgi:hypothetical protein
VRDDLSASLSDPFAVLPRATANSRVVREVDPRASRDLWVLLTLVAGLVGGMALYAWPRVQAHSIDTQSQQNQKLHEQLVEQNRKLRLEKASLESLARVSTFASRLGLVAPEAARVYVVEPANAPAAGAQFAQAPDAGATRAN